MQLRIRVVVVAPDKLACIGLSSVFNLQSDLEVVGDALDLCALHSLCAEHQPHIILLYTDFPQDSLLKCLLTLQALPTKTAVILVVNDRSIPIASYFQANVMGCVLRTDPIDLLLGVVRAVTTGSYCFSAQIIHQLMQTSSHQLAMALPAKADLLTEREYEVATLMTRGLENQQIAQELVISERTVRFHIRNICDKLHFHSRTEVLLWALQQTASLPAA